MKTSILAGAAVALFSVSALAEVKETENFSFDVNAGARVSVENINGDIDVVGDSINQVKIVAHKKAGKQEYMDELEIVVDASADYVRIETAPAVGSAGAMTAAAASPMNCWCPWTCSSIPSIR